MSNRKQTRVPRRLPVSIERRAAALSADISSTGFCLESPMLRAQGDFVSGFVLHGHKELTWTGRIKWVQPGNPMASTWHRMGIEFTTVSPGLRALLSMLSKTEKR
jgi:PilZ domain